MRTSRSKLRAREEIPPHVAKAIHASQTLVQGIDRTIALLNTHGWHQHVTAMDSKGKYVSPYSPGAVSFCLEGAVMRANATATDAYREVLLALLGSHMPAQRHLNERVTRWNDEPGRTKDEVLELLGIVREELSP